MPVDDVTPIRQQYLEIKRQYPNAILFFRLGDFYETFDQDAETTSRELDIVLTSRSVAKGVRVPMAGIPYHAVENYLARLIEKGYHVAICEQVGDQPARGLFPRQVTRVVTPGTIIEPGLLQSDRNNYLVSLVFQEDGAGISYVDISTGEFSATCRAISRAGLPGGLNQVAARKPSVVISRQVHWMGLGFGDKPWQSGLQAPFSSTCRKPSLQRLTCLPESQVTAPANL